MSVLSLSLMSLDFQLIYQQSALIGLIGAKLIRKELHLIHSILISTLEKKMSARKKNSVTQFERSWKKYSGNEKKALPKN